MKLAVLEIAYFCFLHKKLEDFLDKTVKNNVSMMILSIFSNFSKKIFFADKNVHTASNSHAKEILLSKFK